MSNFKQFRQVPQYEDDATFTLTGKELRAIEDMAKAYAGYISVMEQMLIRQLNEGHITIKYVDLDNNELSKDELRDMFIQYAKECGIKTENIEPKM